MSKQPDEFKSQKQRITLPIDGLSKKAVRMILAKSNEWQCTPNEAQTRLLNQFALRTTKTHLN